MFNVISCSFLFEIFGIERISCNLLFIFLKSCINSSTLKSKIYLKTVYIFRVRTIEQKSTYIGKSQIKLRCCKQILLRLFQQILPVQAAIIQVSICLSIYLSLSLFLFLPVSVYSVHQHCIYAGLLISIYLHNCLSILYYINILSVSYLFI